MVYLKERTELQVINIFTSVSRPPESKFAVKFVKSCGYDDSYTLFEARKKEEKALFSQLKIESLSLSFIDAAWRKKPDNLVVKSLGNLFPEILHIYPEEKQVFSGKISGYDNLLRVSLKERLDSILNNNKAVVFCPIGVGGHVDHLLTRESCKKNFKRIIYWADFPYNLVYKADRIFINANKLRPFSWKKKLEIKKKLIAGYKSQLQSLFPSGKIPIKKETYYLNPEVLRIY